jgi:hypothetical protein
MPRWQTPVVDMQHNIVRDTVAILPVSIKTSNYPAMLVFSNTYCIDINIFRIDCNNPGQCNSHDKAAGGIIKK